MPQPTHFAVLDCETTGLDTRKDEPAQTFYGVASLRDPARFVHAEEIIWRQPAPVVAATQHIHRISPQTSSEGLSAATAIRHLTSSMARFRQEFPGSPTVLHNAPYDLSLLAETAMRNCGLGLASRFLRELLRLNVVDTLVLDKSVDKFRKGSRALSALAQFYLGEEASTLIQNAHDARIDCEITGRVFVEIADKYNLHFTEKLYKSLKTEHEEQRLSYEVFRQKSDPTFSSAHQKGFPLYAETENGVLSLLKKTQ